MTEDVSASIRLSITVLLLAAAVGVVANISVMFIGVTANFRDSYVAASNQVHTSTISDLQTKKSVEATIIYKVARESNQIIRIEIVDSNGAVLRTFDFNSENIEQELDYFIENATKRFSVKIERREGYILRLTEATK